MTHKRLFPGIAACLLATTASAGPSPYPGSYSSGGVDSVQQLILLEDNTFCYVLMAGSLDLVAGGHWRDAVSPGSGIELQEVKPARTVFPAMFSQTATGQGKVTFDFHGHSFSNAGLATFAVSDRDTIPSTMRPLFPEGKNGWSPSYTLPPVDAAKARYFILGHATARVDASRPAGELSVTVYSLEGADGDVRIGFDQAQAIPALRLYAKLADNKLSVQGEPFANREPLDADLVDAVRRDCITPALTNAEPMLEPQQTGIRKLAPLRTYTLPIDVVQGTAWFPEPGDGWEMEP